MDLISAKPPQLQKSRLQPRRASFRGQLFLPWLAPILLFTGQATPATALSQAPYTQPLLQAEGQPLTLTPDSTVQEMIDQVQSSTLYDDVAGLSGEESITVGGAPFTLNNRSTTAAVNIEKATQYAYEYFQSLGLATSYHTWLFSGSERRNVIAEQAGYDPSCLYLLTAHLDDAAPTADSRAPGADDNASGAAGVLVTADILSHYHFDERHHPGLRAQFNPPGVCRGGKLLGQVKNDPPVEYKIFLTQISR